MEFWEYVQFLFFRQWRQLKAYVNSLGILIFGDMPIYVAMDSADTWSNPEIFWLTGAAGRYVWRAVRRITFRKPGSFGGTPCMIGNF